MGEPERFEQAIEHPGGITRVEAVGIGGGTGLRHRGGGIVRPDDVTCGRVEVVALVAAVVVMPASVAHPQAITRGVDDSCVPRVDDAGTRADGAGVGRAMSVRELVGDVRPASAGGRRGVVGDGDGPLAASSLLRPRRGREEQDEEG